MYFIDMIPRKQSQKITDKTTKHSLGAGSNLYQNNFNCVLVTVYGKPLAVGNLDTSAVPFSYA